MVNAFVQVEVLTGPDKGKIGIVNGVIKERNWVYVEGLNCVSTCSCLRNSCEYMQLQLCNLVRSFDTIDQHSLPCAVLIQSCTLCEQERLSAAKWV